MTIDINAVAQEFTDYINEFHSFQEPFDDELDADLYERYARAKRTKRKLDWSVPYFSPSSANKCGRELYVKALRAKKDDEDVKPWRRRWTATGTALGDWFQRELLLAEKHYPKFTRKPARFRMERTADGSPAFEDFVFTQRFVEHDGVKFSLLGTTDGILEYITEDGEVKRIGLEIKSKQTTAAQTSLYSMREPKEDHVKQVTAYSMMYDLDAFLVVYVNASKKAWNMTQDDFEKTPDFRVFGVDITRDMQTELLDKFAGITKAVAAKTPPALDIGKFGFNNFKTACAKSLTDAEVDDLKTHTKRYLKSGLPEWQKQSVLDAYEFIRETRGESL
jgi:hypothetical protein